MIIWADYAVGVVLFAAALHAAWNAILKIKGDRALVVMLITGGAAIGGAVAALFLPLPAPAAWPYIAQSTVIHCAYLWGLSAAYHRCDLSVAYPIARGGAPAVVLVVSVLFLGVSLTEMQIGGVILLVLGIFSLAIRPLLQTKDWRGPAMAALTACFIAGYSITDGAGARVAGNPHSYAAWLFICQFVPVGLFTWYRYGWGVGGALRQHWQLGLLGGILSLLSYWMVIWAMTVLSVPVAVALRETSVLFAMMIGVLWLKEAWSLWRWAAACLVLSGVLLLRL